MLATADDVDGLPGHVSGITQSILFLFMCGVQIALTGQEWFLYGSSAYVESVHIERYMFETCKLNSTSDEYFILYKLSYASLLLFLQLCMNPFIVTSQRNYREGLLFCIGSVITGMIWIGWVTMYVIMGKEHGTSWYEKSVCCGLLATPTALLIAIFVPKVSVSSSIIYYFRRIFEQLIWAMINN